MTAERLLVALREHMPATLRAGGLFVNEVGLAWLLSDSGRPKSARQMRELRAAGALPPGAKVGKAWTYDLEDVAAWFLEQKKSTGSGGLRRDAAESGGSRLHCRRRKAQGSA